MRLRLGRWVNWPVMCAMLALAGVGVGNARPPDLPPPGPPMGHMMPDLYAGIGAIVHQVSDEETGRQSVLIADLVPGSPAEHGGLKPGDEIVEVDGQAVEGLTLKQVVTKIRGDAGTELSLTINREGNAEPFEVRLTRAAMSPRTMPPPRPGEPMGPPMAPHALATPVMVAHDGHIFLLIGEVLYKVNAETMQQVGAVRLVPPGPEL